MAKLFMTKKEWNRNGQACRFAIALRPCVELRGTFHCFKMEIEIHLDLKLCVLTLDLFKVNFLLYCFV